MENYKLNKTVILFSAFLLIAGFVFFCVYLLINNSKTKESDIDNTEDTSNTQKEEENYDWLYGKYINEVDSYSYVEITKDSFKYNKNVCEGYYVYTSTDYEFTENVEKTDTGYSVELVLKTEETLYTFTGEYKEGKMSSLSGIYTCSGSKIYVKQE